MTTDKEPFDLLSSEQVRRIAERAIEGVAKIYEPRPGGYDPDARQRALDHLDAYAAALRLCAATAGCMGDVSLLDVVARGLLVWPHFDRIEDEDIRGAAEGLAMLLRAGAPVTEDIERVARHGDPRLRYHAAQGLQPTSPEAIALLEQLSVYPIADVRNAARTALAALRDVPWWKGRLSCDPRERLSPEEQARHRDDIERLSEIRGAKRSIRRRRSNRAPLGRRRKRSGPRCARPAPPRWLARRIRSTRCARCRTGCGTRTTASWSVWRWNPSAELPTARDSSSPWRSPPSRACKAIAQQAVGPASGANQAAQDTVPEWTDEPE